MDISHHGLKEKLPEEWWIAAGMLNFAPSASAYCCDHEAAGGRRVCLIPIVDIGSVQRGPGVRVFNDDHENGISASKRVEGILHAFAVGTPLPPVELTKQVGRYPFALRDGAHRLFCSIAAGFTEIPAVPFIDVAALDAGRHFEELC